MANETKDVVVMPPILSSRGSQCLPPEILDLVDQGIIGPDKKVQRGYIERQAGKRVCFIKAPTLREMKQSYQKDAQRIVHTIKHMEPELVLDDPQVKWAHFQETFGNRQAFDAFKQEWDVLIQCLFHHSFPKLF